MLRALLEYRLYAKLSKYVFNCDEIIFLDFVVEKQDIQIKQARIETIQK